MTSPPPTRLLRAVTVVFGIAVSLTLAHGDAGTLLIP
jgi:hypothetical protein